MARVLAALLSFALAAPAPLGAAQLAGGGAAGGKVTPAAAAAWAARVRGFFAAGRPALPALRPVLGSLDSLALGDPAVREALAPVAAELRAAAAAFLESAPAAQALAAAASAEESSPERDAALAAADKLAALAHPLVLALLDTEQRARVEPLARDYRERLAEDARADLDAKLLALAESLGRPSEAELPDADAAVDASAAPQRADSGAALRSLDIPGGWTASSWATDAGGRFLAAAVSPEGRFHGPRPQRLLIWDLASGELVAEQRTEELTGLRFSRGGGRLIAAEKGKVVVLPLASLGSGA